MSRMFTGNLPGADEGWGRIGTFTDSVGIEWLIFAKAQEHDPAWCTYKIVANGKAENKANYWLVRKDDTGQLGYAHDYAIMRKNRPDLHAYVEQLFAARTKNLK